MGDSLDLVVVGGYYGKGKRTNVYGAYLLACYDSDSEEYQTICKIGTGFSDEALQSHYEALKPLETQTPRGDVKVGGAKPDVWFEPKVVWEVLTADLSLSPIYTAAQGLVSAVLRVRLGQRGAKLTRNSLQVEERGISLRFPRFIKIRDDKDADDATGPEQVCRRFPARLVKTDDKYLIDRRNVPASGPCSVEGREEEQGWGWGRRFLVTGDPGYAPLISWMLDVSCIDAFST